MSTRRSWKVGEKRAPRIGDRTQHFVYSLYENAVKMRTKIIGIRWPVFNYRRVNLQADSLQLYVLSHSTRVCGNVVHFPLYSVVFEQ